MKDYLLFLKEALLNTLIVGLPFVCAFWVMANYPPSFGAILAFSCFIGLGAINGFYIGRKYE